jgi:hypothetical protein
MFKSNASPMSSFMGMVLTFLGIVLWATLFDTILAQFDILMGYAHLSSFTLLQTMYQIGPVILFLGVLGLLGWGYYTSYMHSTAKGDSINMLMWVVFGALQILLFLALFSTVISSLYTILQDSSIASYIALQTVVQISAAIIFLSGIFAGGWNISTGIRNQRKKKAKAGATPANPQ